MITGDVPDVIGQLIGQGLDLLQGEYVGIQFKEVVEKSLFQGSPQTVDIPGDKKKVIFFARTFRISRIFRIFRIIRPGLSGGNTNLRAEIGNDAAVTFGTPGPAGALAKCHQDGVDVDPVPGR